MPLFKTGLGTKEAQASYQFPRKLLSLYNPTWGLKLYVAYFDLMKKVHAIDAAHKSKHPSADLEKDDPAQFAKEKAARDAKIADATAAFFALLKESFATVRNHLIEQELEAERLLEEVQDQDVEAMKATSKAVLAKRLEECFSLLNCIQSYRSVNGEAFRRIFEHVMGLDIALESLELQRKLQQADDIIFNSAVGTANLDTQRARDVVASLYGLVLGRTFEQARDALDFNYKKNPEHQFRILPVWHSINYKEQNQRYKVSQGGFSARLLVGSASTELGRDIEQESSSQSMKTTLDVFANGEVSITLDEPARGEDVFILESVYATRPHYTNEHTRSRSLSTVMMELLLLIQTVKQSSAGRVTAVIPYLPYNTRTAESALIAEFLQDMGLDCLLTVDMTREQGGGNFERCPVYNISMAAEFTQYIVNDVLKFIPESTPIVVVAPDGETLGRSKKFADSLSQELSARSQPRNIGVATAIKSPRAGAYTVDIIGHVEGACCIIIDTVIDEGVKLMEVSRTLVADKSAVSVIAVATHALLSGNAMATIAAPDSPVTLFVTSDSIGSAKDYMTDPNVARKLRILPLAPLLTSAIQRLHSDSAVSTKTLD